MKSFKSFILESEFVNSSIDTQRPHTGGTYRKSGELLKDKLPPKSDVLNFGAGLPHTGEELDKGLNSEKGPDEGKHKVDDYEPYPENRKVPPEYTEASQIPHDHYHAVVCHNVLNVLEPHVREQAMHAMFNSVREGGHLLIGARKGRGDVLNAKNATPGDEDGSLWVKTRGGRTSYQKGFDGNELADYVKRFAEKHGHQVEVKRVPLAATGVHVRVIKKAPRNAT